MRRNLPVRSSVRVGVSALRFGFAVSGLGLAGFGVAMRVRPEGALPSILSAIFVAFLNKPRHIAVVIERQHVGEKARAVFRERSEEHTSELQSLMRISYAVFCLKKKNK